MGLIKIIANNIEIDFVKETLSIKTVNNALSRDFKVAASSYPFLIVENLKTIKGLGTRDLSSVKKNKIIDVIVFEAGVKYKGELQILSFIKGFRKCNLKYSSSLLSIMNKKIADFMPVVSVIPGEGDPVPYSEETTGVLEGSENWQTYPLDFLDYNFPEVKWQFPTMNWINKFGIGLEASDEWFLYKNKINEYDIDGLILNTSEVVDYQVSIKNKNVVSPQVFLLSPLFYALQSIGFTAVGTALNSEFLKRALLLSTKDNLTVANYSNLFFPALSVGSGFYNANFFLNMIVDGTFTVNYRFEETYYTGSSTAHVFSIRYAGSIIFSYVFGPGMPSQIYEGSVEFEVTTEEETHQLLFQYSTHEAVMPPYALSLSNTNKKYYQMHPTIQLGRYVPDWTFGTYLNELQNLFNLEINPDDFSKKLIVDFNEETIATSIPYIDKKSLELVSYDPNPFNAFLLKYSNDEDEALWITTDSVEVFGVQTSNFSETLSSKFKYVSVTSSADLSEQLESRNGVGLMIYDPVEKPVISDNFLDQTLKMNGDKGIYMVYWKKWLKFLLNSSSVELSGYYTETEIRQIMRLKRIFIDHQEYLISQIESVEQQQDIFKIKFSLQSITF
jgi:hypothetical protein